MFPNIAGDDAMAHISGACVGDDFHHDDTVFVTHDAVGSESRQVFKKVLRNGATGYFKEDLVKPDAQKTDGYQISQSLLLDEDSSSGKARTKYTQMMLPLTRFYFWCN